MFKLFSFSLYFVSFLPLWVSVLFIDILSIAENQTETRTEYKYMLYLDCFVYQYCYYIS